MRGRVLLITIALLLLGVLAPARADALSLEPIGTFAEPTYVASDPGDPDRLFVLERAGRIQLVEDGATSEFLDIEPLVLSPPDPGTENNEGGIFSIVFSPGFATDHLFYVTYRGEDDPDTPGDETGEWHLDEFRADGDTADPASRRDVLTIEYPAAALDEQLHYGGQLQFGLDGYLYVSTGDGGPQGDPNGNSQDQEDLQGSILRIDPEGSGPGDYSVPSDNPYAGPLFGEDEIWSDGLRNPWRFSFDRLTGDLAIGDVGFDSWEEVDFVRGPHAGKGLNFGWNCMEGTHVFSTEPPCDVPLDFTDPILEYEHAPAPGGCSVIGGYVVRDTALSDLYGRYLFGDLCVGDLRSLDPGPPVVVRSEGLSVDFLTSFGEDSDCRIYVVSLLGSVYRLTEPGSSGGGCPEAAPDPPPSEPPPEPSPPSEPEPTTAPATTALCKGKEATIQGEPGPEILRGTPGRDVIAAGRGGDTIRGVGGDDVVCGGRGGDTLKGGRGDDRLRGGVAGDRLLGGPGSDVCDGGGAHDSAAGCAVERRI
jgi:glucose/arabinose dehydrogenase